ncbi:peroxynitrite isomerase THAP4-like [Hyperolius riggenbachi]|uniref:peroxynitrite isomerase THAP4-like n=1 Tax=Hyperolius riggenbachi TaxID=752182 RepID=UPI0035A3B889
MASESSKDVPLNPVLAPLAWMLGSWVSDPLGEGESIALPTFRYKEEIVISHFGQTMMHFMFCSFDPESGKPLHRECGFICAKPATNRVAFVCAMSLGVVEVEEGEVRGNQLTLTSHTVGKMSFVKEPHVNQVTRTFRLNREGKLEQTICMETTAKPMSPHVWVTYKKVKS